MSWVRQGDEADMFPMLMDLAQCEGFDHRTTNEVHGFISRASSYSARYKTDYILELGYVHSLLGSETDRIVRMCIEVGLLSRIEVDGRQKLKIVEEPEYIHIRSKADVEWARQQARDTVDPNLKGPVLLRDGDNCRWCGKEVIWPGKASNRKATLDHLHPGEAGTVETLVVACMSCNSARQSDDTRSWDQYHRLLPIPNHPHYGRWSQKYLVERGLLRSEDSSQGSASHAAPSTSASGAPSVGATAGLEGSEPREGRAAGGRDSLDVDPSAADPRAGWDPSDETPVTAASGRGACDPSSTGGRLGADWPSAASRTGQSQGRDGKGRDESGQVGSGRAGPGSGSGRAGPGSGSGRAGPGSGRGRRRPRKRKKHGRRKDEQ